MKHFKEIIDQCQQETNGQNQIQRLTENTLRQKWFKAKPSRTKHVFKNYEIDHETNDYNFNAMDGGKFNIESNEVIDHLLLLRKLEMHRIALVFNITDKSKFFMDVDYLNSDEKIEKLMTITMKVLGETYNDDLLKKYYITKSERMNRYHIFLPDIVLIKERLKMIWIEINSECKKQGFNGYFDRKTGKTKYPIDTAYLLVS